MRLQGLLVVATCVLPSLLTAQDLAPGAQGPYRPGVPRPDSLLGYAVGTRQTQYAEQQRVLEQLAASAPDRTRLETMGTTVEGRPMRLLLISAPANLDRLEAIRRDLAILADPRITTVAEARAVAERTPAVVFLSHSIHGDEPAGFEAAMLTAYELVASESPTIEAIRQNVVTVINPSQNPDGHERFAVWSNSVAVGSLEPGALEKDEPWDIVGRFNHYRFDMNRDAIAQSQPESRALADAIIRWHPQVVVDLHSTTAQYFFPPAALPINANVPASSREWLERIGRDVGAAFDAHGWQYYVRDVFDLFYPGYWDSWPSLQGATGMTFETDGGPDLRLRRGDGTVSTFRDGIVHHVVASLATLRTTGAHRAERLRDYYQFRATGMAEAARRPFRGVVIRATPDKGRAAGLARLLARQGVEVRRTTAPFTAPRAHDYVEGTTRRETFPAGSYVVDLVQPQARLATALLEPNTELDSAFVQNQMAKYERNRIRGENATTEGYEFYDVTAWTLPLTLGLAAAWVEDPPVVGGELVGPDLAGPIGAVSGRAGSAYVFDNAAEAGTRLALALLDDGYKVAIATKPLRADGRSHPAGTFVVRVQRNPATLHDRLPALAALAGAQVTAVQSAFPDSGAVGVGSESVVHVRRPRILLAAGEGVATTAYGDFWFYLERELGVEVTPVRVAALGRMDLEPYNVLIIPGGSAGRMWRELREEGAERLKGWVSRGGCIIGVGGAIGLLGREELGLTTVKPLSEEDTKVEPDTTVSPSAEPGPPLVSPTASGGRVPAYVPGAIVRGALDRSHWLTLGYREPSLPVLLRSSTIYQPSEEGDNPVSFVGTDLTLSGFTWPDTEDHLRGAVWASVERHGLGTVVLFAGDPLFRAFWRGPARLVTNALLLGPGKD